VLYGFQPGAFQQNAFQQGYVSPPSGNPAPSAYRRYEAQLGAIMMVRDPLTREQTHLLVDHLRQREDDEDDDLLLLS